MKNHCFIVLNPLNFLRLARKRFN